MAAVSQNGYTASPARERIHTVTVAGTNVRIPVRIGASGDLLMWAAARWHREVEPLVEGWCWGWAYREIRGGGSLSNHASGTAIDLNAPRHPLGTIPSANFSAAQIATIRRIVADAKGCLRWGGDYTGRADGMHLEVIKNEAECARVLASVSKPPTPAPTPEEDVPLSAAYEAADRARWAKADQLEKDLRGDLNNKRIQMDRIEAALVELTKKVDALTAKHEEKAP